MFTNQCVQNKRGFTLLELMLAMTLMTIVMGSVFASVRVGIDAYDRGTKSMEQYQSARIGLRKTMEELQFSLSQASFWQPGDQYSAMSPEVIMAMERARMVRENDPGKIRFHGDAQSVLFVRKIYQLNQDPPFDLQECKINVDAGNQILYLEVVRSLLTVKRASWYFQQLYQTNLKGYVSMYGGQTIRFREIRSDEEPPLAQFIGDAGKIGKRYVLAYGVKGLHFRYTDGDGWKTSWSSEEVLTDYRISPNSPNFNATRDLQFHEKGPPLLTEITLDLANGDTVTGSVEIGSGNMRGRKGAMGIEQGVALPGVGSGKGAPIKNPGIPVPTLLPNQPGLPQPETPSAS
ncbi:prepilin-type N-terminal cleavage/methylation domain-containing protein [bacterium]|nr:prepilin-type N-terminal cleavage/methylation domain-containing protein [bacterium]